MMSAETTAIPVDYVPDRAGHPLLRALAAFPIALFTAALLTDFAYWRTANVMWTDFSCWLLAVGMAFGVLAAVVGLVAWARRGRVRTIGVERRPGWPIALGSLAVLIVAFVNNLVHSRDAWTTVVPEGIILSALTVALIVATIWASAALGPKRTPIYQGERR